MAVLPILGVVGALVSAAGALAGGLSQMNAADAAADQSKAAAAENARRHSVDARKRIGLMRANFGASGVTLEGSPMDILEESARNAELDRLTILHGGQVQSDAFKAKGQAALFSGIGSAASGALMGGADVFTKFQDDAGTDTLKRIN